ncbi:MAG: HD domain-containing protein [Holophaga sp.]|nr:HD domain-containing protein [Holophaga sp.]
MMNWRDACEAALRAHTEADAIRFWGVSHPGPEGPRPVFDYRFEHTLAVVKLARWLAPLAGADPEVVECAAWLHDSRKFLNSAKSKDTHARDASAAVEGILAGTDFPPAKIAAVRNAIEHHVGLKRQTKLEPVEAACLWDADKLSKIGAASLVHFSCISGAFEPIDTAGILQRGLLWLELARTITTSMNTPPGRAEAERRLAFITAHYQQLQREWADPMEPTQP